MKRHSRRTFLAGLASTVALMAIRPNYAFDTEDTFELLVIGDSLMSGQGLNEEEKTYTMVKNWLAGKIFKNTRSVNMTVFAHSGATIVPDPKEKSEMDKAGLDILKPVDQEVNVSFPTLTGQLELASASYTDPAKVDMILLSGGAPEVSINNILNPFNSNSKLKERIDEVCFGDMSTLLTDAAVRFPNAMIVVLGYYPIISPRSPMKKTVDDIWKIMGMPGWLRPFVNNPVKRTVIWRRLRSKMVKRSAIWKEASDKAFQKAIDQHNSGRSRKMAVFVENAIKQENGYATENTMLWTLDNKGYAADPLAEHRKEVCGPELDELRSKTKLNYRTAVCERASIGHPNIVGAAAMAEGIIEKLTPVFVK